MSSRQSLWNLIGTRSIVVSVSLAVLFSFLFARFANQIVAQEARDEVEQMLDSVVPIAAAAAYWSSNPVAELAITPLIRSGSVSHIELWNDFDELLVSYQREEATTDRRVNGEHKEILLRLKSTDKPVGKLVVNVEYKPDKYVNWLNYAGTAAILFSNLLMALVFTLMFRRYFMKPVQRLQKSVFQSGRLLNSEVLKKTEATHGSPHPTSTSETLQAVSRKIAQLEQDYGARELNDLSSAFNVSLIQTIQATLDKEMALDSQRTELSKRLALTAAMDNVMADAGIALVYILGEDQERRSIGCRLPDNVQELVVALSTSVETFKALFDSHERYQQVLELTPSALTENGTAEYVCDVKIENEEVWTLSLFALADGGKGVVCTDITSVREKADELEQAKRLESIGVLTSGVAHEINNILAIIQSSLDCEVLNGNDSATVQAALSAVARGASIVQQLLDASRKDGMASEVIDSGNVIQGVAEGLQHTLGDQYDLNLDLQPRLAVEVNVRQFETSVSNLIVNARDAMEEGGQITIKNRMATSAEINNLPDDHSEGYMVIDIIDLGSGIEPGIQGKLFEPFFTTKAPGKGTGLGLSMAYGFAQRSGGRLQYTSAPGKGTRFSLLLPLSNREPEHLPSSTDRPDWDNLSNYTLLLVDDEESFTHLMKHYLQVRGANIHTASGFQSAQQIQQAHPDICFDIVVTDMFMRDGSGVDVCRYFKGLTQPPVTVLVSGNINVESMAKHERMLFDHVLMKPFRLGALSELILQISNRSANDTSSSMAG